ncbi:hypothetical protein Tco_0078954 [Tanacetum coccineum]
MKIPIIRKGEYNIWSMSNADNISTTTQLLLEGIRKDFKSHLALAIPDEYLLNFSQFVDANHSGGYNQIEFGGNHTPSLHNHQPVLNCRIEDSSRMDGDDLEELGSRWNGYVDSQEQCTTNRIFIQAMGLDGLGGYVCSNDFAVETSSTMLDGNLLFKLIEVHLTGKRELKDKIAKWEESTKNLDEIFNSQMSARDKTGLGYGTQLNELISNHETDRKNSLSIFDVRSSDEENTPENDRFSKNRPELVLQASYVQQCQGLNEITWNKFPKTVDHHAQRIEYVDPKGYPMVESACSIQYDWKQSLSFQTMNIQWSLVAFGSDPQRGKITVKVICWITSSSKAFRVYNKRTKRVEENLHINFLEDPNVIGTGPNWMFDLDFLTNSMNYISVSVENKVNGGTVHKIRIPIEDVAPAAHEKPSERSLKDNDIQDSEDVIDKEGQHQMPEDEQVLHDELEKMVTQELTAKVMDDVSRQALKNKKRYLASQKKPAPLQVQMLVKSTYFSLRKNTMKHHSPNADLPIDPNMPDLEDASDTLPNDGIFNGAYDDDDEDVGVVVDFNNMDNTIAVSPIPTLRIHKDHPKG